MLLNHPQGSPAFCGLQQQLNNQVSTLSDIAASLQQLLASSRNPKPRLPQPPSSQPVAATLTSATLPAANTAGSVLGAPLPACATNNPNLSAGLGAFLLHVIQTDRMHTWPLVTSYVLTTCQRCFGHASAALWAQQDQAAWNQHLSTAAYFCPPPKSATPGSANHEANTQPSGPPSKRQKGLEGSAQHIDGPTGPPNVSTPPLQGLAQLIGNSASTLDLGTPLLQGSAQSVIMPAGLGGTRTPLLQGLAWLFDLVLAALNVPSADRCLSLLLNAWSHNPGLHPNTSFAGNVFDPASQPSRHGSMQEHAFVWSTLLSLYPDPVYHHQLLGMTKHGCLLGYNRPLRNADCHSNNLPISSAGHSHLCREIDTCLAKGHLSIIPASNNLIELPIGVVPKPRSTKLRTIHHLSHPRRPMVTALPSVNAGISPGFIRIRYEGLQDLLAFVSQNPGCLLWKGNLEDAFRHVVTAKCNAHLLGFSYDGIRYRENALTFGGSSSPWLFNLVAKFLHWLVAACLPANWPPRQLASPPTGLPANWPPRQLASPPTGLSITTWTTPLALSQFHMPHTPSYPYTSSPWQRMPWAFGFHPKRPSHRSADLLNMQWIASLLQFVSQVFLCGKAFLRRLYDTTRCALPGKRCLTRPACSELIWWCDVLELWSGTSVLSPSLLTAAHIWTDACPKGYGGYLGLDTSPTAVFAKTIPCCHCKKNIHFLEALTVLAALQCFLPHWSGPTLVMVHVDNKNVEHGLRLGCSCNPLTQRLLWEIFGLCLKHDLTIRPQQVLSTDNVLADLLSHQHFLCIQLLFPCAHDALFSHPASMAALQVPHLVLLPVLVSLLVPPTSCGMALLPAPAAVLGARPRPSSPSASDISGLAHPVFRPRASNCWSGSPTSPALVALSTWPSTGSVPSDPTTWTLALTPQVLLAMGKMADLFPQDCLVLQAVFALTFACFLRSGELVWDHGTNCATILTVSSVKWASDHVVLTLPASKTDPFRQGVHVVAPEVGGVDTAPPPPTSSHSAGGAPTATAATSTDWLRSAVLWSHWPSSLSAMAPWFPAASPGEIQAWPDPGLLAPNPIKTTLSCAGTLTTGLVGWEPSSSSPHLDPCNLFSVFSSWPCPCPI
ncbi:hypothetical protein NDA13_001102 [Ustilago tritici]|nr:hypothetical protein NDA13_001102 [Ustilago tritici]